MGKWIKQRHDRGDRIDAIISLGVLPLDSRQSNGMISDPPYRIQVTMRGAVVRWGTYLANRGAAKTRLGGGCTRRVELSYKMPRVFIRVERSMSSNKN